MLPPSPVLALQHSSPDPAPVLPSTARTSQRSNITSASQFRVIQHPTQASGTGSVQASSSQLRPLAAERIEQQDEEEEEVPAPPRRRGNNKRKNRC